MSKKKAARQRARGRPKAAHAPGDANKAVFAEDGRPRRWWRQVLREPLALCLVVPVIFRPWLDGITYPTDNFYFVWFLALLFVIWSVRLLLGGASIRFGKPIAILAAFFLVAVLTGLNTIQVNATYRMVLMWAGYFFLFVLVTNGLRTRLGIGIVLGAFVVVLLAQSAWSLLHLKYVLPYVRQMVNTDPRLLMQYFGVEEPTPELTHRLNTNRAFGSLLFPNALGAFLILGIPYAFVGTAHSGRAFVQAWRARREARRVGAEASKYRFYSLVVGTLALVTTVCAGYFLFTFFAFFAYAGESWTRHPVAFSSYLLVIPLAISAAPILLTRLYGPMLCGLAVRATAFPLLLVLGLVGLWRTYSRGAMIGLVLASIITVALFILARIVSARLVRRLAEVGAVALLVALLVAGMSAGKAAWAQNAGPSQGTVVQSQPTAQASGVKPQGDDSPIKFEGRKLGVKDLANLGSLRLRMSYWRIGLRMAKAYFWTGVGLGNFGTAYPKYQLPGAADVKMAHNDYLQTLCETGIFGFLAFGAFWLYFVLWGAWRIIREPKAFERLILAGLYAGVLGFLFHSFVDFNFYNPSLAFYVYLLAGLFYVLASLGAPQPTNKLRHQLIAVPFLAAAALVAGMALRVYLPDYIVGGRHVFNVGNDKVRMMKLRVGEFFLREVTADPQRESPAVESVEMLAQLIPLRSQLESFGRIWAPAAQPGGRNRRLGASEPVPPGAFLAVTKPVLAREVALDAIERWLKVVKTADSIFPYDPEIAAHLVSWYDLLLHSIDDPNKKREYTFEYLNWAKVGVERSSIQPWYHEWYAKGLWLRANLERGAAQDSYLRKGLEEFRLATELYPSSPMAMQQYGDALRKFGNYLKETNREAEGEKYRAEARRAFRRAEDLAAQKRM